MRNKYLFLVLIVVLLASLMPISAFAGAPVPLKVVVWNTTGAEVNISLTDANGNMIFKTLEAGNTSFELTEGKYSYYANTVCGNQSGEWNINVAKVLYIVCDQGAPILQVTKFTCNTYINWGNRWGNTYQEGDIAWELNGWENKADWKDWYHEYKGYRWECRHTILPRNIWGEPGWGDHKK